MANCRDLGWTRIACRRISTQTAEAKWRFVARVGNMADPTPPPAPVNVKRTDNELSWEAEADLESGIACFLIQRDGVVIARRR